MPTRLDYRPNEWGVGRRLYFIFRNGEILRLFLAEKPNVRTLRILFYETKQGNTSSPGFLNFHKRPWRELERCNCQLLLRDTRPENLSRYHDNITCLGESRDLS